MRRITELDAIRGLAAMAVMIYHLDPSAFALHGIRVDLFLVMSGFLLTSIILRKADSGRFLVVFSLRRWFRTWPIYFVAIGAAIFLNRFVPTPFPMDGAYHYLTFTQNITRYWSSTTPAFNHYFEHTWSLAIEEQFYLVWPSLVLLLGRSRLLPAALSLLAMSVTMRALGFHWWLLLARCDGFALGSILAILFQNQEVLERRRKEYQWGFAAFSFAAMVFTVVTTVDTIAMDFDHEMSLRPSLMVLSWNLLFFGLIGLVILNSGHANLRVLRNPVLKFLGQISYGTYLFHPFVFVVTWGVFRFLGIDAPLILDVTKILASLGVASLSWYLIEEPISRLKSFIQYESPAKKAQRAHAPQLGGVRA